MTLEYYEIISGLTTIPECQAWSAKQSVKTQNIRGTQATAAFMTHSSVVMTTTMIIMVPVTTTTIFMVPVTILTIPVLVLVHMSRKK